MSWSFVLIPDTQHLALPVNGLTGYYYGLRDWLINNYETHDIRFIGGLGDMVNTYGDVPSWTTASDALTPLFDLPIPVLLLAAGNHDTDVGSQQTRQLTSYNTFFPPSLYSAKPWFGGMYEPGHAENMWAEFTIGEHDYLAFMLEFHPRSGVLDWVSGIAAAHPDHRSIVLTHSYLYMDGQRTTWATAPHGPSGYFTENVDDATSGEEMWTDCFKGIPGLFGVFNGHFIFDNVSYSLDTGDAGNTVLQGFYNWQGYGEGGRGRMMLMTVDEDAGTIRQRVIRPDLDAFESGSSNGFLYDTTHQVWEGSPSPLDPGTYSLDGQAVDIGGVLHVVQYS